MARKRPRCSGIVYLLNLNLRQGDPPYLECKSNEVCGERSCTVRRHDAVSDPKNCAHKPYSVGSFVETTNILVSYDGNHSRNRRHEHNDSSGNADPSQKRPRRVCRSNQDKSRFTLLGGKKAMYAEVAAVMLSS